MFNWLRKKKEDPEFAKGEECNDDVWRYNLDEAPDGEWVLVWIDGPGVVRVFRTKGHWFPYDPTNTILFHWRDEDVKAWTPLLKHPDPYKVKR